jgi:hypothetical protein
MSVEIKHLGTKQSTARVAKNVGGLSDSQNEESILTSVRLTIHPQNRIGHIFEKLVKRTTYGLFPAQMQQ